MGYSENEVDILLSDADGEDIIDYIKRHFSLEDIFSDEDIIAYVSRFLNPEDVFDLDSLVEVAKNYGYTLIEG
jgi:hypothetical protein